MPGELWRLLRGHDLSAGDERPDNRRHLRHQEDPAPAPAGHRTGELWSVSVAGKYLPRKVIREKVTVPSVEQQDTDALFYKLL